MIAPLAGPQQELRHGHGRSATKPVKRLSSLTQWENPCYGASVMNEGELSKRIDDLHRRFDDLRSDVGRQFADLRADMATRFAATDKRIDDLRADMNQRLTDTNQRLNDMNQRLNDMNQRLTTLMWVVSAWFTFLTAVLAVFGFLRR